MSSIPALAAPRASGEGPGRAAAAPLAGPALARELVAASRQPAAASASEGSGGRTLRPASPYREPGLQQRVAAYQQGLDHVDGLLAQLQRFKADLLAQAEPAALQRRLQDLTLAWQQRPQAGVLDAQLRLVEPGQARQRFAIRGLDLASLRDDGPETLRLALPGRAATINVPIDPAAGPQAQLRRIDQLLAPAGVRVSAPGGELQFSVAEAAWPVLREGLSLRGDGRRFPSGQLVRARLEPLGEALQPAQWRLDGAAAQRETLARLAQAQLQLQQARAGLSERVAGLQPVAGQAEERASAAAMQGLAAGFAAEHGDAAKPMDYETYAALAPALKGLRRECVQQLLGD
ncbi:hypothetical protein PFX98_21155 [Paucibacter sediminis]|uniref:Uncharacterized protein n=1 Tax=Paucibacter sediminis TaxID=3019553 RepID=A0AA95SKR6_9BURK|nr:hypothetical protein [Paucibacter sp. S2-9]WIT11378.1 hypothetical protein PFX98_21155 [Paucibacter sp. S2-9]